MQDSLVLDIREGKDNHSVFCWKIEVGVKLKVREDILKTLKEMSYIQKNFKLNIKCINRWWWSVYFAEKCEHNYPLIDNMFCSKCGEKI